MAQNGAYVLAEHEPRRLSASSSTELGAPEARAHQHRVVGRDAARLLAEIGVRPSVEPHVLVAEVSVGHSLVWMEQMTPVRPWCGLDVEAAIDLAARWSRVRQGVDPLDRRRDDHAHGARDELLDFVADGLTSRGGRKGGGASGRCRSLAVRRRHDRARTFSRDRR